MALALGWLLLATIVPLAINLWGQQPFELPKAAIMRTLVWALATLTLLAWVRGDRPRPGSGTVEFAVSLAILGAVVLVTTATAADWRLSLWGSTQRAQGTLTLVSYALLAGLAAVWLRRAGRARLLVSAVALGSLPLIALALLQSAGVDPFGLVSDARSPVYATLGRANFLGAYLAALLPLTLALLLTARQPAHRLLWAGLLAAQTVTLGLTLARGAWLAAMVGGVVFTLLWFGNRLGRNLKRGAWVAAGLLALAGPVTVFVTGSGGSGSAAARFTIWRAVLDLIRQRPLLGYGPDSLALLFPTVFPPELVYYHGRTFFVDRAHNLALDWLATAGVPGLLAFLLVLAAAFWLMARAWRRRLPRRKRALLAGITAAVLANAVNNLVSFDVTATATLFWLLLGVGVGLAALGAPRPAPRPASFSPGRLLLVGLLAAFLVGAIWHSNIRPVLADVAAREAEQLAREGAWADAAEAAARAVARWPVEPAHHLRLSHANWQLALAQPAHAAAWLARSEDALLAARALRPANAGLWQQSARFYAAAARQFGQPTGPLAQQAYARALTLAPHDASLYLDWGRANLAAGEAAAALPLLRRAAALDATDRTATRLLEIATRQNYPVPPGRTP